MLHSGKTSDILSYLKDLIDDNPNDVVTTVKPQITTNLGFGLDVSDNESDNEDDVDLIRDDLLMNKAKELYLSGELSNYIESTSFKEHTNLLSTSSKDWQLINKFLLNRMSDDAALIMQEYLHKWFPVIISINNPKAVSALMALQLHIIERCHKKIKLDSPCK